MATGEFMRERGFVTCVAGSLGSRADMFRAHGWRVETLDLPTRWVTEPFAYARALRLVRHLNPALLVATSATVASVASKMRKPYVLELNDEPRMRIPWSTRRLQAVIVPDSTMVAAVVNRGGLPRRRIRVLPHAPIVAPEFAELAAQSLTRDGALRLGCAGYLDDGHGTRAMLEAHRVLCDQGRAVELFIFGEGPMEHALRKQAREMKLAEHTTISAPAAPSAVKLLASLDIYVSPMLERSPGWLAHLALALGLPTIFTTVSGAFELVKDGIDGRMVERGDAKALAAAIEEFCEDPSAARDLGRRARSRWLASGRLDQFRAGWQELLSDIPSLQRAAGRRTP